jgi:predicted  nucleic acid-binding Zn-ribbon protein
MSKAEPLYRLQLLDIDLDKARKQLQQVEAALASNPAVLHAQAEVETAHQARRKIGSEVKLLELDARTLDDKIKEDEDRLYKGNIRTPKELIDLQREIETVKVRRNSMEEPLLSAMLLSEEAADTERRCQAALAEAHQHWQADSVALREEQARLKDHISADEERREAISISTPRADLTLYTTLRAKKPGGVAVTVVKDGSCGQCGESPSSVLLQQARTGSSLALCSGCGRIMFVL